MGKPFLLQGAATALSMMLGVVLPRFVDDPTLAGYLLLNSLLQTGLLLSMLGTRPWIEREYGGLGCERGPWMARLLPIRLRNTLWAVVLSAAVAALWRRPLPWPWVAVTLGLVLFRSVTELGFEVTLASQQAPRALFGGVLRYGLRLPGVLLGYHWGGLGGMVTAVAAVELLVGAYSLRVARPYFRWSPGGEVSQARWRRGLRYGRELALYSVLVIALNHAPPYLSGIWEGSATALVDFLMGWQLALQGLQLFSVSQQAQIPHLARWAEAGDSESFHQELRRQQRLCWTATGAALGTLLLGGPALLTACFGPGREGLLAPLQWGVVTVAFWGSSSVRFHGAFALGRTREVAWIQGAMVAAALSTLAFAGALSGARHYPALLAAVSVLGWGLSFTLNRPLRLAQPLHP